MAINHSKILIIDDEEIIRMSLTAYLEDLGYQVLAEENGYNVHNILNTNEIDLVLLDLRMPGKDGFEIVDQIVEEQPKTPIIVMSGTSVESAPREAVERGAWFYLHKPMLDETLLQSTIKTALERAKELYK